MRLLALFAAAAALSACGGGGSDSPAAVGPAPVVASFNLDRALTTLLTTAVSFPGLSAKDAQGNTYGLSVSYTPSPAGTLNGVSYAESAQNIGLTLNGAPAPGERFPGFYLYTSNPTKMGAIIAESRGAGFAPITSTVYLLSGVSALPTAAQVGASATYATAVYYGPLQLPTTSTAGATPAGNLQITWSLEADTASTAYFCFNLPGEKECFKVNPAGDLLGARFTITVGTQALTFN